MCIISKYKNKKPNPLPPKTKQQNNNNNKNATKKPCHTLSSFHLFVSHIFIFRCTTGSHGDRIGQDKDTNRAASSIRGAQFCSENLLEQTVPAIL